MLHTVIDETLELLTADELSRLHWSVDVWERAGQMSSAEAVTWRERISGSGDGVEHGRKYTARLGSG